MPKTDGKHEIAIENDSGKEFGLTLVRKNGIPQYFEGFDYAQATQFYNATIGYGRYEAERRLVLAQQDYQNGFGKEYASGVSRYHTGTNIDARFENEVRAGPLATNIKIPPTPSSARSDGSGDVAWTNQANSHDESTITYASIALGNDETSDYLEKTFTAHDCANLRLLWYGDQGFSAGNDTLSIEAYHTSTWNVLETVYANVAWSSDPPDGDDWRTIAIGSTKSVTGIRLKLFRKDPGGTINLKVFEFTTDGAGTAIGAVQDYATFNSIYYVAAGKNVYEIDTTNYDRFRLILTFAATIPQLYPSNVAGTDYLFVMQGWSVDYWYMTAAKAFVQTDNVNAELKHMVEINGTFWGDNTNSTLMTSTAPLVSGTDYATAKQMGEDAYDIVSLVNFEGLPYVKKSDCKVYYVDSSGDVQPLINMQANLSGTNTPQMFVWREAALIIPYGEQGLLHYDGTTLTHIQPALFMNNATDFSGQVIAVAGDEMCLYILLDDGDDVQLMSSKIGATTTDWGWHPLGTLTITGCNNIDLASVSKKRLYIGSNTAAEQMNFYTVTTKYGDIKNDSNYAYQTGGSIEAGFQHYNLKGDTKAFLELTLTMASTDANVYWKAYYKLLGGSWTPINAVDHFKVSPQTSAKIGSGSSSVTSTMMNLKFEEITNSASSTPLLLGYKLEAVWYPKESKLISCTVRVEDNLSNLQGMIDDTLGSDIRKTLDNINSSNWPRAFYPLYWASDEDTIWVKKLPLPRGVNQLEQRKIEVSGALKGKLEWVYNLLLESISVE